MLSSLALAAILRPLTLTDQIGSQPSQSTASTIGYPSGARAGDLAVLYDHAVNTTGGPTAVTPTGWTNVANVTTSTWRGMVSYKVLTASDLAGSVTGMNGTSANNKVMMAFRPNRPIRQVIARSVNSQAVATDPTAQTVTVSEFPPFIVMGFGGSDLGTATFATATPAFDNTFSTGDSDLIMGWKIYNNQHGSISHTIDIADLGNNTLISFRLKLE